ncbi:MAG: hypothetical protein RIS94_285 [Pseudomonadota bacterium]|jgi:mono/diheme cytochrome c family protein
MPLLARNRRFAGRLIAFVSGIGLALAACAGAVEAASASRTPEAIYTKTCGYCHGQHVAPVIRGRSLPPELIAQFVRAGPRSMPAFRQTEISDAELAALARWVSTSKADPKEHDQ